MAHAQARVAGSIALVSDDRFRGISLSDDAPALQGDLDWSDPDGFYAGAFASSVHMAPCGEPGAQWLGYAGYARRIDARWNWEAGLSYAAFTRDHGYDYAEAYAGLISDSLSVRIHYSPHYFGYGPAVMYLEADGARELSPRWRLLGHVGVLRRLDPSPSGESSWRGDARIGLGVRAGVFDLQLAAVTSGGGAYYAFGYPAASGTARNALVFSASRQW